MFIKAKHNIYGKEEYCYINTRYIVQAYPPNQWSNLWLVFYTEKNICMDVENEEFEKVINEVNANG